MHRPRTVHFFAYEDLQMSASLTVCAASGGPILVPTRMGEETAGGKIPIFPPGPLFETASNRRFVRRVQIAKRLFRQTRQKTKEYLTYFKFFKRSMAEKDPARCVRRTDRRLLGECPLANPPGSIT